MKTINKSSQKIVKLNDILEGKKLVNKKLPNKSAIEKAIEQELQSHYTNLQELRRLEDKVKEDVKKIGQLTRQEEKRLERLTKDINLIDGTEREFHLKNVIAKLVIVPKYKSYAAPYKELWLYAMETVGVKLRKIFVKQEQVFIKAKVDAKTQIIQFTPIEK